MGSLYAFQYQRCVSQSLRSQQIRSFGVSRVKACGESNKTANVRRSKGIDLAGLEQILLEPTWSVESLLPTKTHASDVPKISSQQLHHLLRLSALPPPESPEQEQKMLETLAAQLHFVGKIQKVDTTGLTPLRALRDETKQAEKEQTISMDTLKEALSKEKVIGLHHKRIQRDTTPTHARHVEAWDVLGSAERKSGKYFVVEGERPQE